MPVKLFSEIKYIEGDGVIMRRLTMEDKDALYRMTRNPKVYRYLPDFLFEKKYEDTGYVIDHLYDECIKESLILGIESDGEFCGLTELYGYREEAGKISVGCRLAQEYWGRGIVTKVLKALADYLFDKEGIRIITASAMPENKASARALKKSGFVLEERGALEDWGFGKPTPADKWILTR